MWLPVHPAEQLSKKHTRLTGPSWPAETEPETEFLLAFLVLCKFRVIASHLERANLSWQVRQSSSGPLLTGTSDAAFSFLFPACCFPSRGDKQQQHPSEQIILV